MTAIRHFGIVVADLDRMLAFYCGALGLTLRVRAEESGDFVDGLIGFPGTRVTTAKLAGRDGTVLLELLHFVEPASPPRREIATNSLGPTHAAFTVEDLDGLWRRLSAAGIRFNAPPRLSPDGGAKVAYARDPEGNFLELVEMITS